VNLPLLRLYQIERVAGKIAIAPYAMSSRLSEKGIYFEIGDRAIPQVRLELKFQAHSLSPFKRTNLINGLLKLKVILMSDLDSRVQGDYLRKCLVLKTRR
jgi:hypothetical protein